MKKYLFIISIIFIFISCIQSQEDKANAIIKAKLRKTLLLPDSYKPIETKIDSAFSPKDDPVLYELIVDIYEGAEEIEVLERDMKSAKSSMSKYQSALGRDEYNEAKEKYDDAYAKIEKIKKKGRRDSEDFINLISQEPIFMGFRAIHNYRADNNEGNTLIGNDVFILDPELERVMFSCTIEKYNEIQNAIKKFQEQLEETQEAIKEYYQDN